MTARPGILTALATAFLLLSSTSAPSSSDFATDVIEYFPAPGQWVNITDFNTPGKALGPPVGIDVDQADNSSIVTLGAFGGYIVLKFDHTVTDDPCNPMGLDTIVFGNAFWKIRNPYWRWQEPGHVEISRDTNGNGVADDPWYLIPGSHSQYPSMNWTSVSFHRTDTNYLPEDKAHYPSTVNFPGYPDFVTFFHILLPDAIVGDYENPNFGISDQETVWGYCDLSPTVADPVGDGGIYLVPDNPYTVGLIEESGGGDALDIADAIDPLTGDPAELDGFDFVRITSGSSFYYSVPFLLEISTEVDAVSDVEPFDELRAFWELDEDNPTQPDSGGYDNSGVVSSAVYTPSGRIGGAYSFDGVQDYIAVDEHFTLDIVDEITIDCWIRLSQLPSSKAESTKDATIIAKGIAASETIMNYEFLVDGSDTLKFRFYDDSWQTITSESAFTAGDVGVWRHIALTCGRKSASATLFIDGECVAIAAMSGRMPMNDEHVSIGARFTQSSTENHFPGDIDQLRLECVQRAASTLYARYWTADGDSDADSLPDLWETVHFGSLAQNGSADPDSDGAGNSHEYAGGTDPNDSNDFFAVTSIKYGPAGAEITFNTVKGWTYDVLYREDFEESWKSCGTITGDGTGMTFLDEGNTPLRPNPGSPLVSQRLYTVRAR